MGVEPDVVIGNTITDQMWEPWVLNLSWVLSLQGGGCEGLWREEMVIIDMMQRCTRSIFCSFEGDFYKAKESESLKQFY